MTSAVTSVTGAPSRRRQRSARLTVAVLLLALAVALVAVAIVTHSWIAAVLAAVVAVVLGAAATRITHTEVLDARREANHDRAEQARAYLTLTDERIAENAAHQAHLTGLLTASEEAVSQLEAALAAAHQRAADAIRSRGEMATRAQEALARVAELEQELDVVRAELAAERAATAARRSA